MLKALIPLSLLLLACNSTETHQTKKVSLNLKETCTKGEFYSVGVEPSNWFVTLSWKNPDGTLNKANIDIGWEPEGFRLPCAIPVAGDSAPVLTINYD